MNQKKHRCAIDGTEAKEVLFTNVGKKMATVAFGFNVLVEGDDVLHLDGAPQRRHFNFM